MTGARDLLSDPQPVTKNSSPLSLSYREHSHVSPQTTVCRQPSAKHGTRLAACFQTLPPSDNRLERQQEAAGAIVREKRGEPDRLAGFRTHKDRAKSE